MLSTLPLTCAIASAGRNKRIIPARKERIRMKCTPVTNAGQLKLIARQIHTTAKSQRREEKEGFLAIASRLRAFAVVLLLSFFRRQRVGFISQRNLLVSARITLIEVIDDFIDVAEIDAGFFAGGGVFDCAIAADHFVEIGVVARLDRLIALPI